MLVATHIVHAAAGSPLVEGVAPAAGPCAICGASASHGIAYKRWEGSSFTGQSQLARPGAAIVCAACAWATSWVAPPGYVVPEDKARGKRMSFFSHFWDECGGYWYAETARAQRLEIRAWFEARGDAPWFAAIATDGKKHALPYAPVNLPGARPARIQMGEETADLPPADLLDAMDALLAAGCARREIEAGEYHPLRWKASGAAVLAFERAWGLRRHSGAFRAAVWLADAERAAVPTHELEPAPREGQLCLLPDAGS